MGCGAAKPKASAPGDDDYHSLTGLNIRQNLGLIELAEEEEPDEEAMVEAVMKLADRGAAVEPNGNTGKTNFSDGRLTVKELRHKLSGTK